MTGAISQVWNCGEPTLLVTISSVTSVRASGGNSRGNVAPRTALSAPTAVTASTETAMSGVSAAATASTPGAVIWKVRISKLYSIRAAPGDREPQEGVAATASICSPRPVCSVRKPEDLGVRSEQQQRRDDPGGDHRCGEQHPHPCTERDGSGEDERTGPDLDPGADREKRGADRRPRHQPESTDHGDRDGDRIDPIERDRPEQKHGRTTRTRRRCVERARESAR